MQVAKYVDGSLVAASLFHFYPNTSFDALGPSSDFVQQEQIYFIDNNLVFDPASQKLVPTNPYLDGQIVRTMVVAALSTEELATMNQRKSGQVIDDLKIEATRRLDEFAKSRGYDNITSVASYANSTDPDYLAEANRAIYLRDRWWRILTTLMNEVLSGARPIPESFDVLAAELPALTWDA